MRLHSICICLILLSISLCSCSKSDNDCDASGVFEVTEVIVSARGNGIIGQLDVTEGMRVNRDSPLGHIDTLQLSLKRRQLMASLTATDSRILNENRQLASLRQQLANARSERRRFEQLVNDNAVPRKQLDDIDYQIEVIERQIAATADQLGSANSSVAGQASGIAAQVAQVDAMIGDCIITSPIDGIILSKYAEAGEYAVPGKPLFKVGDMSRIYLRAYIQAPLLTQVGIGDKVTIYADSGESDRREYQGTISWISDEAEFTPKTIQTRDERSNLVYAVKISIAAPDSLIKRGMYGDVKF